VLSTDQKGSIAEIMIAATAIKLGIDVYKPINDGTRCDLVFDLAGKLTRVQCKWAAWQGETLIIRCYRHRRTRDGLLRRLYTADEVDAFAAYCLETDKCTTSPFTSSTVSRTSSSGSRRLGTINGPVSTGPRPSSSALHLAVPGP
jgi:hypothetical protein